MDFRSLCLYQRSIAPLQRTGAYTDLVARYEEPHRKYHTLTHAGQCLEELWAFEKDIGGFNPYYRECIEQAIWFHDAVYVLGANDNEARSADLAYQYTKSDTVRDMVLATAHLGMGDLPQHPSFQILVSIDLSILGKGEAAYNEYRAQIRQEYISVPLEGYLAGRKVILEHLLAKPIYPNPWFAQKYEEQARKNLTHELKVLRSQV